MSVPGAGAVPSLSEIGRTLAEDLARLDEEAAEIELLVQQIRAETERHEGRRLKGEERVTTLEHQPPPSPGELDAARVQLLTLTRRAAMMDARSQVLEGKQRTLQRYRDHLARLFGDLAASDQASSAAGRGSPTTTSRSGGSDAVDPRAALRAQEQMRRDIARQMHDGPASSSWDRP